MVKGKNYPLKHALAYETKFNDEEAIAVVLSGQPVSSEDLKKAREEEKEGQDAEFKRPYLKLEFTKAGELKFWSAGAGDTSLGRRSSGNPTGELKVQDGRVIGKASQPTETEGMFPSGFDVRFDVRAASCRGIAAAHRQKKAGPRRQRETVGDGRLQGERQGREAGSRVGTLARAV